MFLSKIFSKSAESPKLEQGQTPIEQGQAPIQEKTSLFEKIKGLFFRGERNTEEQANNVKVDSSVTQSLLQAIGYKSSDLCASTTPFSRAPKKSARKAQRRLCMQKPMHKTWTKK